MSMPRDPFVTAKPRKPDYRARAAGHRLGAWAVMLFIAGCFGMLYLSWIINAIGVH